MKALSPHKYLSEDRGYDTPCWIWQRGKSYSGYGQMHDGTKYCRAHRHYYEQANGPIPEGLQLDHLCRQRDCVNPDHLEPVTPAENCRRGAKSKLTDTDAATIRALAGSMSQRKIAARYGINQSQVSRIINGHRWCPDTKEN